jgi:hypothetical protein
MFRTKANKRVSLARLNSTPSFPFYLSSAILKMNYLAISEKERM